MAVRKQKQAEIEPPIPEDLARLSSDELCALDDQIGNRSKGGIDEFRRLIAIRDAAQLEIDDFRQRQRDLTRAILKAYEKK